ncbi:MAG: response regulator transcription factor [Chloroflexota bacterium]
MSYKILIIEDEPTLQETLAYNLKKEGYQVDIAADGKQGVDLARINQPNLVILDIMLPILDGFEVCRILRQEMNTPILMLTARDSEFDRVLGLEMGADDYVVKPFVMRELMARVKALLRRVRMDKEQTDEQPLQAGKDIFVSENLTINLNRRQVYLDGEAVEFKPKEFDLIQFFFENKGRLLSREFLLERVWGWDFGGGSRTVDVHVHWLREKIEIDPANPKRIITVRSAGYRFEG